MYLRHIQQKKEVSLTEGSIVKGLVAFIIPLFLGQIGRAHV